MKKKNAVSDLDKRVDTLFREIMSRCRSERKGKTSNTVRALATQLDKTENYISAIENGREFPSMKTFLKYLLINEFDSSPLSSLTIQATDVLGTKLSQEKHALIERIYKLNNSEILFLAEQSRIAGAVFRKKRRSRKV